MIRGTTPIHVFSKIPVLSQDIDELWISYLQSGKLILNKSTDSITIEDDLDTMTSTAQVKLTQEDTLLFKAGPASIQMRILLKDGTALASDEVNIVIKRIINDGPIS